MRRTPVDLEAHQAAEVRRRKCLRRVVEARRVERLANVRSIPFRAGEGDRLRRNGVVNIADLQGEEVKRPMGIRRHEHPAREAAQPDEVVDEGVAPEIVVVREVQSGLDE
jgi:hypothetical protein